MSVLVKSITMPKNCNECPFYRYWDEMASSCEVFDETKWIDDCDMKKERHPDCPLIEVPPHGRLIDADALAKDGWCLNRINFKTGLTEAVVPTLMPIVLDKD